MSRLRILLVLLFTPEGFEDAVAAVRASAPEFA
jgi:hypothetical protein